MAAEKSKNKKTTAAGGADGEEAGFIDYSSLSVEEIRKMAEGEDEDRTNRYIPVSKITKEDVLKPQPMTFWEEAACVLFLAFVVPNGVFTIPPVLFLIGKFIVGDVQLTFTIAGLVLLPLTIIPQPFIPSTLQSWISVMTCKYFSFRFITEERPPEPPIAGDEKENDYHPQIYCAPPHGVFPYGNILSMLSFPSLFGHNFFGLASSAALRPPIFKQVLRSIGVVDASRDVARKVLEAKKSIGISTGGVAEVFETNADDECVMLKSRIGLIKLAIRTGSAIVPCYLFGNTKLLSCWHGEGIPGCRNILETISRKLGFALILVHGRFGLPIPYRLPVLAVMGKPIPTHQIQCEEPTQEQIDIIQTQLLDGMQDIFDRHKHLYGWENKKLIIK
mmetsp:Transcript_29613/g.71598  ORF Transcript_29613/g.71598 Transcript_29613/m.71598 type:complete len:390 (-) Transcript_29613:1566-2735(-)|eukprot:CAMPEP_0113456968 /NCGR_PEP_ID=MMETSP0014_2-20120614/9162_1 /TAXON_ID=2857 /ORGANISM="Nitzschia sp." /LENGTH=389 /DNA_ID=CAMNT_0000348441 /DNA_START=81 /DNA_END=1250 /DNA_ORIENTATION=- /assembly_acc=CAM_ASM_000159